MLRKGTSLLPLHSLPSPSIPPYLSPSLTSLPLPLTSKPLSLKRKVFNQCVLPVLTYGTETWRLTKHLELSSARREMEGKMQGITRRDTQRAPWIREQTKVDDILATVKNKKWAWAGLVTRAEVIAGHR